MNKYDEDKTRDTARHSTAQHAHDTAAVGSQHSALLRLRVSVDVVAMFLVPGTQTFVVDTGCCCCCVPACSVAGRCSRLRSCSWAGAGAGWERRAASWDRGGAGWGAETTEDTLDTDTTTGDIAAGTEGEEPALAECRERD